MAREPRASWRERFHRLYPEREVIFRSRGKVRYVVMSARVQAALTVVALAGLAWVIVASVGLFVERDMIAARNAEIAALQTQYDVMAEDLKATRQEFEAKTLEFVVKHRQLVAAVAQQAALEDGLGHALRQRDEALGERDEAREEGATMARRLGRLESDLRASANASANSATSLAYARASLDATSGDRDRALDARERIEDRSDALESRLSELQDSQVELLARIYERARTNISELETTLAMTGLDVQALVQEFQAGRIGMGGPLAGFDTRSPTVAPEFGQGYETVVARLERNLERWEDLKNVLRRMPLSAPTDSYYVSSGFGKRKDPLTKRWAMHYGTDFSSSFGTPVLSTAAGTVTFAGRNGPYGLMVEIDHGLGLKTRYGHLHKTLVRTGDTVEFRREIGLMGSTGRSTGSHVHYEIVLNGETLDAENFLKAGRHVFKN